MRHFTGFILALLISKLAFANSGLEINVLKSCSTEFAEVSEEMKSFYLETSVWNYDRDYEVSQVVISDPYDLTATSFSVNVYIDLEGIKDFGYVFVVEPIFMQDGSCSYIDLSHEEM